MISAETVTIQCMFDDSEPGYKEEAFLLRHSSVVLLASIVGIVLMMLFVMSGIFDPKSIGTHFKTLRPGLVVGQEWLTTVPDAFSVQMMIDSAERESAILYGTPDEHIAIAIGTDGYLAIWYTSPSNLEYLYPWQTWVHVNSQENELWLDVQSDHWTIRINREVFYEGVPLARMQGRELGVMGNVSAEISTLKIFKQ